MSELIGLKIPEEMGEEIEKIIKGKYRSRQEFIMEALREKLTKLEQAATA